MKRLLVYLPSVTLVVYLGVLIVINAMNLMICLNKKDEACNANNYNDFPEYRIWLISIMLGGGVVILFGWLLICLFYQGKYLIWDTIVTHIKSENDTLQTMITEKTIEITDLQRQLNNERNNRRLAGVENSLLLHSGQENERERLLTGRRSDYQAV